MRRIFFLFVVVLSVSGACLYGQSVSAQAVPVQPSGPGSYGARFDVAWQLVAERYWDTSYGGNDWAALKREYRPEAVAAKNDRAFYRVLERLYDELGDQHSVFVPPAKVQRVRQQYGDLPCLGVFGFSGQDEQLGRGALPPEDNPGLCCRRPDPPRPR